MKSGAVGGAAETRETCVCCTWCAINKNTEPREGRRNDPLEPCAGKLARTVLRGRGHSDVSLLPGEMVVTIAGKKHYLWRAVDQDGFVLEALVQSRRNTKAAKRLLRKLLKK